ncbi:hypothetical protein B9K06_13990 [Bacillus sp. OG2]|nr:hypothetical protein B9K06_13990 [Bacillus sp. OG2]
MNRYDWSGLCFESRFFLCLRIQKVSITRFFFAGLNFSTAIPIYLLRIIFYKGIGEKNGAEKE